MVEEWPETAVVDLNANSSNARRNAKRRRPAGEGVNHRAMSLPWVVVGGGRVRVSLIAGILTGIETEGVHNCGDWREGARRGD